MLISTTYSILAHICSGARPWLARKVLLKRKESFQTPYCSLTIYTVIHILKNVVNFDGCTRLKTFYTLGINTTCPCGTENPYGYRVCSMWQLYLKHDLAETHPYKRSYHAGFTILNLGHIGRR